ncbi:MAG: hypothetical protein QM736_11545 [Vicinamibacterales bacterium]
MKTLAVSFGTVAVLLVLVFLGVRMSVRDQVRRTVTQNLDSSQRMLAALEDRRLHELRVQAETLAESPTLKAALDTYAAEQIPAGNPEAQQLLATLQRELDKLAARVDSDAIALATSEGQTLAVSGRLADAWQRAEDRRASRANRRRARRRCARAGGRHPLPHHSRAAHARRWGDDWVVEPGQRARHALRHDARPRVAAADRDRERQHARRHDADAGTGEGLPAGDPQHAQRIRSGRPRSRVARVPRDRAHRQRADLRAELRRRSGRRRTQAHQHRACRARIRCRNSRVVRQCLACASPQPTD